MGKISKIRNVLCSAFAVCLLAGVSSPAFFADGGRQVVPIGSAVEITLDTQGVIVAGYPPESPSPAQDAGILPGDIITAVNGVSVASAEDMMAAAEGLSAGESAEITVTRGSEAKTFSVTPAVCDDGSLSLGLWLRDSMSGLGTVTFYDPESGTFGALGHPVSDIDTGITVPVRSGQISETSVNDVVKGEAGTPGQLMGSFQGGNVYGDVRSNTICGIFGTLSDTSVADGKTAVEVASEDEIHTGEAVILSNISGQEVKEYTVEITRVYSGDDTRSMMIRVTDPELIAATGGIVQGMSGSPIMQDGKLIGAVTHVLVKDPTEGYGISIEKMLETADAPCFMLAA